MKMYKKMRNQELASLFRAVAAAYQLKNEKINKFKIIAYERAADAIEHLSSEAKDLWDENKLRDIPGVGLSISKYLNEIFSNGESEHLNAIIKNIPPAVFELIDLPRIGPKKAFKLVNGLKLNNQNPIEQLKIKALRGEVSNLADFGPESEEDILKSIETYKRLVKRKLLPYAIKLSEEIISWLKDDKSVDSAEALGSIRRKCPTIGDIDIAVVTSDPQTTINKFIKYPKINRILEKGKVKASILVGSDQIDLMVCDQEEYGSLLAHFTGSKHHNIALREFALSQGLSLSEYGIRSIDKKNNIQKFSTEEAFYKYLGIKYIPPVLREDSGEIEAAKEDKLPDLLELKNIKADFHLHSNFDTETSHDLGLCSFEEIVDQANQLGYEYIAFSEHNPRRLGHSENDFFKLIETKRKIIDKYNYSLKNQPDCSVKKLFNSLEIDILPDGSLAIPSSVLDLLDFCLVSIHSSFNLNKIDMTNRILKALSYPKVKILAHPTARKLNYRESIEADWNLIFERCAQKNIWIEIDADPARLDLPDFLCREATKHGLKFTIGTDAHDVGAMKNMVYGVYVAQRGWLTKEDIINCKSLIEFEEFLRKKVN